MPKKVNLNLDSVQDIPCFWCVEESRDCVVNCPDLDKFLGVN